MSIAQSVFGLDLDNEVTDHFIPDDLVVVGAANAPVWRVIHVDGETAWIRRTDSDVQGLSSVRRLTKVLA
jgi:hypothetical protein